MAGLLGKDPETLHDLLRDEGIELHEIPRPGGKDHGGARSKLYCPQCQGGREKERNFFVKIDPDGKGFRYVCFRASNCGISGGRRLKGAGPVGASEWKLKVYRKPEPPAEAPQPDSMLTYFAEFGISAATVEAFGIYRTEQIMPVLDLDGKQRKGEWAKRPVQAYPYRENGSRTPTPRSASSRKRTLSKAPTISTTS